MTAALDPYAQRNDYGALRFLHRLNPLAKIAATLPVMVLLVINRELETSLAFIALAVLLLLIGAHLGRIGIGFLLVLPFAALLLSFSFSIWITPEPTSDSVTLFSVGSWSFTLDAWLMGLNTVLRLAALVCLSLITGLTTAGPDLVRSAIQHLRLPYRVGYAALAAYRFVPRFAHELAVIRAAHRVRGMAGGRGLIAAIRRYLGYVVPLLAGGIRHAERVALAMDSRAFGALPQRTERYLVPFRQRDVLFMVLFWLASAALFVFTPTWVQLG